jgi:hypothetical protein
MVGCEAVVKAVRMEPGKSGSVLLQAVLDFVP